MFSAFVTAMPSAALPQLAALRVDASTLLVVLALSCVAVLAGLVAACARRVQSVPQESARAFHEIEGRSKRQAA